MKRKSGRKAALSPSRFPEIDSNRKQENSHEENSGICSGRDRFTMQFEHYEAVPFFLTEQIIKARRAAGKIR